MKDKNVEIDEEKEPTIELKKIEDLETKPKKETPKKEEKKTTNSKKELEEEKEDIDEQEDDEKETKKSSKKKDKEDDKSSMKKIAIITGISVSLVVIVIIILIIILRGPDTKDTTKKSAFKSDKYSKYVTAINNSLKDGSLDSEIKKAILDNAISTETVELVSLDIDSDKDQELIAYAEDNNKKYVIKFEVDDKVYYDLSYQVDSRESLGYVYSIDAKENYWYLENAGFYTVLGKTKLVIKEENFLNSYFSITKEYNKKPFLSNTIIYKLDKDLDAKEIEEKEITTEKILKDNNTTISKIKEAADEYVKNRLAEEQKKAEEEAMKKQKEEEAKREALSTYEINGNRIHYGKYVPTKEGKIKKLTINKDGTGTINDTACTWIEAKKELNQGEGEIAVIEFTCHNDTYNLTAYNNDNLTDNNKEDLKFSE